VVAVSAASHAQARRATVSVPAVRRDGTAHRVVPVATTPRAPVAPVAVTLAAAPSPPQVAAVRLVATVRAEHRAPADGRPRRDPQAPEPTALVHPVAPTARPVPLVARMDPAEERAARMDPAVDVRIAPVPAVRVVKGSVAHAPTARALVDPAVKAPAVAGLIVRVPAERVATVPAVAPTGRVPAVRAVKVPVAGLIVRARAVRAVRVSAAHAPIVRVPVVRVATVPRLAVRTVRVLVAPGPRDTAVLIVRVLAVVGTTGPVRRDTARTGRATTADRPDPARPVRVATVPERAVPGPARVDPVTAASTVAGGVIAVTCGRRATAPVRALPVAPSASPGLTAPR